MALLPNERNGSATLSVFFSLVPVRVPLVDQFSGVMNRRIIWLTFSNLTSGVTDYTKMNSQTRILRVTRDIQRSATSSPSDLSAKDRCSPRWTCGHLPSTMYRSPRSGLGEKLAQGLCEESVCRK